MSLREVNVIVELGYSLDRMRTLVVCRLSTDVVPSHPYPYQEELYK